MKVDCFNGEMIAVQHEIVKEQQRPKITTQPTDALLQNIYGETIMSSN